MKKIDGQIMKRLVLAGIVIAALACSAEAQQTSARPGNSAGSTVEGVGVATPSRLTPFAASKGTDILRHRSAAGTPCLTVGGFPRAHFINKQLFDHVITVKNDCAQRINLQVCYYQSQDCINMQVPGDETKQAILGTLPMTATFRFEFREKF